MINWGALYESGRCKAIGIPWSEKEAHAVYVLKIPVDYVRQGYLTVEEYEKAVGKREEREKKTGKIALLNLKKNQLKALCEKRGITVTDDAPRPVLIETLLNAGVPKSVPIEDVPVAEA